jgi:hypothetical protein
MVRTKKVIALAMCISLFGVSSALSQRALETPHELRVAAVGETRVVMIQRHAEDEVVWEWTFLDEEAEAESGLVDTVAISVMYDCTNRTRRPLVLEAYLDGTFVSETPIYEEPAPVAQGTLVDGAMEVVCEPETNSEGATFPDMVSAREAMDHLRHDGDETAGP